MFTLIKRPKAARPPTASAATGFQLLGEGIGVLAHMLFQDRGDQRREVGVLEPVVFKTKARAAWDLGGSGHPQRNMVRGKASSGGEGTVRESGIPVRVNEAVIQANQSRVLMSIAPSVGTIHQRQLEEC